jgi:GTP-binding protein HflX
LFNALVKARAYAADQLFATLDTTTRQLYLADATGNSGTAGRSVSLSDTVGFIRDLPHGLIAAFQATLQEAVDADLLLHVVDAANPNYAEQMAQVQSVLKEIGAADIPQVLVFNKLDAIEPARWPQQLQDTYDVDGVQTPRVFLSAREGQGIQDLRQLLAQRVFAFPTPAQDGENFPENTMTCS